MQAHSGQPTLVFGHHQVTQATSAVGVENANTMGTFTAAQATQIETLYAANDGVFFHQAGHTHRNARTTSSIAPNVTFQEVGATKEYPGGFSVLRIFTGGYAVNFYKTRSELAKEWSEITRQEDFTGGAYLMFGDFGDRNYVVTRDMSGITAPAAAAPATLPETPYTPLLAVAGLAAAGLVVAGRHRHRGGA